MSLTPFFFTFNSLAEGVWTLLFSIFTTVAAFVTGAGSSMYRRPGKSIGVSEVPDLEPEIVPIPLPPVSMPARSPMTINILAVDDNPIDRTIIARLLRRSSFNVTTVDSPLRALELLGVGKEPSEPLLPIDLIVTDYSMPDMTGFEFLKTLQSVPALIHIPLVFVSSENERQRINSCIEGGAKDFILKPVKFADVKRIVQHLKDVEAVDDVTRSRKRPVGALEQDEFYKRPRLTV